MKEINTKTIDTTAPESEQIISFQAEGEVIMSLDEKGMLYKGERIEDAGLAHKRFLETLDIMEKT
jgi:hypothetical protein